MTRRRLLLASTPVLLIVLVLAARLAYIGSTEDRVLQHFTDGVAAARADRLADAEDDLRAALALADPETACALRVNLELVSETRGDRTAFRTPEAVEHYRFARGVVEQAPPGCFAGNTDADPGRRAVRENAAARLDGKIAAVSDLPPPPALGPPAPPPASTAESAAGGAPVPRPDQRLLRPEQGDPLDKLQEVLRDAAAR